MGRILKGAPVVERLSRELSARVDALLARGISPTLAIVRVGERQEDISYERGARKRCQAVGVSLRLFTLPEDCPQSALEEVIRQINADDAIHGCLLFRPLPAHIDERRVCELLLPEKDVDCVTSRSLGGVFTGSPVGFPPCTAQACLEILDHYQIPLEGRRAAVIGRSLVIGRPAAMMLMRRNATVTICHTKTADMASVCRQADILIAAAGRAGMVNSLFVSPEQTVVDVGINVGAGGTLCGDADFSQVEPLVGAITPVPGGVGSVTSTVLAKHVVEAAERRASVLRG